MPPSSALALSPKHRAFALAYLKGANATEAAIQAGYAPGPGAWVTGSRLLRHPKVAAYLEGRIRRTEVELDSLILELARVAYEELPDMGDYIGPDGAVKPLHELTITQRRALAGVDVVKRNLSAGDRAVETVIKVRLANVRAEKVKAAAILAELCGWLRRDPPPVQIGPIFQLTELPQLTPDPPAALDVAPVLALGAPSSTPADPLPAAAAPIAGEGPR